MKALELAHNTSSFFLDIWEVWTIAKDSPNYFSRHYVFENPFDIQFKLVWQIFFDTLFCKFSSIWITKSSSCKIVIVFHMQTYKHVKAWNVLNFHRFGMIFVIILCYHSFSEGVEPLLLKNIMSFLSKLQTLKHIIKPLRMDSPGRSQAGRRYAYQSSLASHQHFDLSNSVPNFLWLIY